MPSEQRARCRRYLVKVTLSLAVLSVIAGGSAQMHSLNVDHVTVCGAELEAMRTAFASIGLGTDYGGPHTNGVTHMALVGFQDGSYLELIAPQKGGVVAGSDWGKFMEGDAGPCAWAVGTTDIREDVSRLKAAGIVTSGPIAGGRRKRDGTSLRWETASVGPGTPGSQLPFLIEDKTERSLRVQPSASVKGTGLRGVAIVVLGVQDLRASSSMFQQAYGWKPPQVEDHPEFGARLAYFAGTSVVLAAPNGDSWLSDRLAKFGPSPVAFLMGAVGFDSASKRFALENPANWFGLKVGWFEAQQLRGVRLGVVEEPQGRPLQ